MTIEQLISKLKLASAQPWTFAITASDMIPASFITNNGKAYDVILDGAVMHRVTQDYIEPIPSESFAAKKLIDTILSDINFLDELKEKLKQWGEKNKTR